VILSQNVSTMGVLNIINDCFKFNRNNVMKASSSIVHNWKIKSEDDV